ncbi:gamma-glutamyltransferase [Marinobacter sp.]|uniref:gamma-glutamyltransferase n=1 Tax=Marinobacter sp. TaxID=50741 RepID=UPI003A8D6F3F
MPFSSSASATQIAADKFISQSPDLAKYFLTAEGEPLPVGTLLKNPELAETLDAIATHGASAFYRGAVAQAMVEKVNAHNNPGTLSLNDLSGYQAKERDPACGTYKQWKVCGRKIKCHPNYRTLQRSNSCKNPFKTMTYFNSAICKRFVGMEAGIIKVSS